MEHGSGCVNGMISDENFSSSALSVGDIQTALLTAESNNNYGQIELLGMDACLMANFETSFIWFFIG